MSLFGGMVVVLYDASKGIPKALDFDGARFKTMSSGILGSAVVLSTNCYGSGVTVPYTCTQYKPPPISSTVTSQVDESFANALTSKIQNSTFQTASFQTSQIDLSSQPPSGSGVDFDVSISFSTSVSVITTPVISLTILTTISIIVSTAATLWGSQQKIKEGVILVTAKVKELLEKRRAATTAQVAQA